MPAKVEAEYFEDYFYFCDTFSAEEAWQEAELKELVFQGLYTAAESNVNLKELNVLYCK